MNKTVIWSVSTGISAFILANLINYSPLKIVLQGDLQTVADKHLNDSKDNRIRTLDVRIDLTEEQRKRLKMDLLENRVKQEDLKLEGKNIPVVYKKQETQLKNEISFLKSKLEESRNEKISIH